jgi:ATP-binding cassette subfamily B protein
MGAMMERDMRSELFNHYQKLSFSFYDEQKTGKLMSRITNDLLSLTELFPMVQRIMQSIPLSLLAHL